MLGTQLSKKKSPFQDLQQFIDYSKLLHSSQEHIMVIDLFGGQMLLYNVR